MIAATTEAKIDSLDWSIAYPWNFRYFKYPKTTPKPIIIYKDRHIFAIRNMPEKSNHIADVLNRAKAVLKYFLVFTFGSSKEMKKSRHVLDPEFGKKWSKNYEAKYGKNGEKLIEFLGSNPRFEDLVKADVI